MQNGVECPDSFTSSETATGTNWGRRLDETHTLSVCFGGKKYILILSGTKKQFLGHGIGNTISK